MGIKGGGGEGGDYISAGRSYSDLRQCTSFVMMIQLDIVIQWIWIIDIFAFASLLGLLYSNMD